MIRSVVLVSACVVLFCGVIAAADEGSVEKRLTTAKEECTKANEKARAALLADLKKKEEEAQKAGDLKRLERVQAETRAFEAEGTLPSVVSVKSCERQVERARDRLDKTYDMAVKQHTKEGNVDLARATQNEWDDFKKVGGAKVDARNRWVHENGEFARTNGNAWVEKSPNGTLYRYVEVARTDKYIELHGLNGDTTMRYRLFNNRADFGKKTENTFITQFGNGKWAQ